MMVNRNIQTLCYLVILYGSLYNHFTNGQTGTDAKNLRKQLFEINGYDKKIRPRLNQTDVIEVNMSLALLSLNELSEVTETLKTTAYLSVSWYDDFLQWNETDYGGLYYYQWPQDDIWKPDIALKNSYLDYKELGVKTLNAEIWSDGQVDWYPFQVFQSTCSIDITHFPFDIQTCELKFVAWSYTPFEVTLYSGERGVFLDGYEKNPEWDIIDTGWKVLAEDGSSSISFSVKMKRKPLYILLAVIMPITMLALLNIFVFVLPCDSGEKASYAITVFLAFAVFLTIVSSTLPENSESVAIFSVFLIIQTVQSTMITLIALIMIRCNSFEDSVPVPKLLQFVLRTLFCVPCRSGRKVSDQKSEVRDVCVTSPEQLKDDNINPREQSDEAGELHYFTWKQTLHRLDVICFVSFTVIFSVSFIACACLAAGQI